LRGKNEEGETVNWLRIKVLRFEKDSRCMQYKYRYGDKFSSIKSMYVDEVDPQLLVFQS